MARHSVTRGRPDGRTSLGRRDDLSVHAMKLFAPLAVFGALASTVAQEGLGVINPSEQPTDGLADDMRRALQARYAEPNRRLAQLLGPSFPVWS